MCIFSVCSGPNSKLTYFRFGYCVLIAVSTDSKPSPIPLSFATSGSITIRSGISGCGIVFNFCKTISKATAYLSLPLITP